MKQFMQSVNSCLQCRNSIKRSLDVNYCGAQPGTLAKMEKIYMQNKDGLTETCPGWAEAATVARSFELIQHGHPTSISVGEMSNGNMWIKIRTKRADVETIETGMVLGSVAFSLLSEAMFRAAHDESVWQVEPNKENENDR